jgi:archaeosortase A (PGF-CTERM-specific)
MLDALLGGLEGLHQFSDPLAWAVIVAFLGGSLLELRDRRLARYVLVAAWVSFAAFWLTLIHYYAFESKSIIEGVGTVAAVPLSLYVAWLLYNGRDSLFILSRAIAVMGLVFMPFEAIPFLSRWLIETVTRQTEFLMALLGQHPTVLHWPEAVDRIADINNWSPETTAAYKERYTHYRNTFFFVVDGEYPITYTIRIACTGIGSMAIFAGLIGAVRAPLRRKLRALAISLPIIYALNLVRNVFIGLSFGQQRMHFFPNLILGLFGSNDPYMVSYFIADRILSQSLSVIALVAITFLVVRELPEVLTVVEDLLFIVTGTEYDLMDALDVTPVRADGEGE